MTNQPTDTTPKSEVLILENCEMSPKVADALRDKFDAAVIRRERLERLFTSTPASMTPAAIERAKANAELDAWNRRVDAKRQAKAARRAAR